MTPIGWLTFRSKPEDYGMLPDGEEVGVNGEGAELELKELQPGTARVVVPTADEVDCLEGRSGHSVDEQAEEEGAQLVQANRAEDPEEGAGSVIVAVDEESWTVDEALGTSAFWVLSVGNASVAATGTAYFFHLTDIVQSAGIEKSTLSLVFPLTAISTVVARLAGGAAIDL